MLYTKGGFPQINEIVLCTVKRIYANTVFVTLNEYDKEGVLTISEIAPGRIRNLRDHVVENKEIICKILRVDERQKRIDVSLRRVPIPVMRVKLEEIKKEGYADRMYEDIAKTLNLSKEDLFEKTYEVIFENYESVFEAFYTIMLNNNKINDFTKLTQNEKERFIQVINDRIKPEEITFKKKFKLTSIENNGIEIVKEAIKKSIESLNYEKLKIIYLAAGEFEIKIIHDDLKSANQIYDHFKLNLQKIAKNKKITLTI